ncbi:hypothetical protein HAX54_049820, partial [Datura stramonium]|nr:hypothetical protein [Datura stramonium]
MMAWAFIVGIRAGGGANPMVGQTSARTLSPKGGDTRFKNMRGEGSKEDNFYKRWLGLLHAEHPARPIVAIDQELRDTVLLLTRVLAEQPEVGAHPGEGSRVACMRESTSELEEGAEGRERRITPLLRYDGRHTPDPLHRLPYIHKMCVVQSFKDIPKEEQRVKSDPSLDFYQGK